MKYLLGFDIGSSSVKAAILEAETGKPLSSAFSPEIEMQIHSPRPGFAEQDPELWWSELVNAVNKLKKQFPFKPDEIISIGISYQMHGLVCVDKNHKALRPAIIWCDSRAVQIGDKAFKDLGELHCLEEFLNSPGNFTASKLRWVIENEPGTYKQIYKVLLPGDYIACRMTGVAATTVSGLSEGIFWNFRRNAVAKELLSYYSINEDLLADIVPTFGEQGKLEKGPAIELGLSAGTPVCYRAGDQPNNAFSLQALNPGEIAATAGTSGVIYGVTNKPNFDRQSRVNPFVHVNHSADNPRYGILLCVNGTGILNSWLRKNFLSGLSYAAINAGAEKVEAGSEGLRFYPFGNGAERMLENRHTGATLEGLDLNRHEWQHVARSAQEGIVFALRYGAEIMEQMGMNLSTVRAGHANMFLSDVFATTFANITGCRVELYNTDGAIGAARASGVGSGYYPDFASCFEGMNIIKSIDPVPSSQQRLEEIYHLWKQNLLHLLQ
ncbi:MAG: carbohydrate kinase [Bacteroidetes bacterium]|nr:MAG: carbohydrate kinase [Bacteroidota bacterium]